MKSSIAGKLSVEAIVAATIVAWLTPVSASILNDVQPPPWRGEPGTTSQYWHFNQPDRGPIAPDGVPDEGQPWLPSTQIVAESQAHWVDSDPVSGRYGIWSLGPSADLRVTVDNYQQPNPVKLIWVQVVWQDIPGLPATGPVLGDFVPPGTNPIAVGPVDLEYGWFETTYRWEIYPNPPDEIFTIGGNINVDQVIIDTWCIPEPSALLLAMIGGGLLLLPHGRRS
jgi:hypothetical protein